MRREERPQEARTDTHGRNRIRREGEEREKESGGEEGEEGWQGESL